MIKMDPHFPRMTRKAALSKQVIKLSLVSSNAKFPDPCPNYLKEHQKWQRFFRKKTKQAQKAKK